MKMIFKRTILCGVIALTLYNCEQKNPDGYVEGSITGTFLCPEIVNKQAGDTIRGFCILLKNRENSTITYFPMDLYAFGLPDASSILPNEIFKYRYNGSDCGPQFFPDSLISNNKLKIKYRYASKNELIEFVCGPCTARDAGFPWRYFRQIIIEDIQINLPENQTNKRMLERTKN